MARIRSIKPEFWHDRKLARACSRDARMLYAGLWNHADEHGRANGDPAVIKGQVFPYDDVDVAALLAELVKARRVLAYEVDGDPFLFLPKLHEHQRLDTAKVASKFPEPPADIEEQPSAQVTAFPQSSGKTVAEPESTAAPSTLLYGTGSMGQGTGDMGGVSLSPLRVEPAPTGANETQRANALTKAYAAAEPLCKFPAVSGIVRKAVRGGRFTDQEIGDALLRLAHEGRAVTEASLLYELQGMPGGRASPRGGNSNMDRHAALIRQLEQGESA